MTIPIMPGPFSFLAGAGSAAGAIGRERRGRELEEREEAQRDVLAFLNLVQTGAVPRQTLMTPEAQGLFASAGLPPVTEVQEDLGRRLQELEISIGKMRKDALTRLKPEQRDVALTGAPTTAALRTGAAAATTAEAQVPSVQAQTGAMLGDQAAEAAVTSVGLGRFLDPQGNVTPDARQAALEFARNAAQQSGMPMPDEFLQPLVNAALERHRFDLRGQELQAMLANARMYGYSYGAADDLRKRLQDQVDNANLMIDNLQNEIDAITGGEAIWRVVGSQLSEGVPPSEISPVMLNTYTRVQGLMNEKAAWQERADKDYQQLQGLLNAATGGASPGQTGGGLPQQGQAPGATPPPSGSAPKLSPQQKQDYADLLRRDKNLEPALDEAVRLGAISEEDAAEIRELAETRAAFGRSGRRF